MVPTSDERREVAARLRSGIVARNIPEAYVAIVQSIGVRPCLLLHDGESGDRFDRSAYELALSRLADLIDPTCHDTLPATWDTFECSECGTQWAVSPVYIGPDGTTEHDTEKPSYCPNCGARVTSGGER